MKIETLAVHAGHSIDPATGAVSSPIYLSTTFERDAEGTYSRGFMYTRNNNPNRQALEEGISTLEGGSAAAAFASGTGASMSIFRRWRQVITSSRTWMLTTEHRDYCAKFSIAGDWILASSI